MKLRFRHYVFVGALFCFVPQLTQAAALYIDPPLSELNRGDAVELSVRLDVDESIGECVNAVDAVISYTSNIAPVDISLGDSIFSMWVQQPIIDKEARTISFAGGMPNGYCGRIQGDPRLTNTIVKLIFRSPGFSIGGGDISSNEAKVDFTEFTTAYLNDGLGTSVAPQTYGARMTLSPTAGSGIVDPWREAVGADDVPPEEFSIFLSKDEEGLDFSGKYYISFSTTDKQTGIDQYQVMEQPIEQFGTFTWGRADAPWITARSPYVLDDQSLNSVIRVRALDKAGNEYIATLIPDESLRTLSQMQMTTFAIFGLIILIVLGCVGIIVAYVLSRLRKKKADLKNLPVDPESNDTNNE